MNSEHEAERARQIEALLENLDSTERHLRALARCLQQERQYVALFEIELLLEAVHERQERLEQIEALARQRSALCAELRAQMGLGGEGEGQELLGFLRALAEQVEEHGPRLERKASELESLMRTVRELQQVNRAIVSRASRWVNEYLGQLLGHRGIEYDARGRMASRSLSTLRRTV